MKMIMEATSIAIRVTEGMMGMVSTECMVGKGCMADSTIVEGF